MAARSFPAGAPKAASVYRFDVGSDHGPYADMAYPVLSDDKPFTFSKSVPLSSFLLSLCA